jgi:hypothetical protein
MAGASQLHGGDRRTYVPGNFDYKEPTITVEKARELAASQDVITLARVKEITPDVAKALVGDGEGGMLTLPAVEKLDLETAKELARFKGNLRLWGLRTMTPEVARAFAETKTGEDLDLSGLTDLSVEVAEILAPTDVIAVWLGVRTMSVDLARALVPVRGYLIFPDLETLPAEAAAELAKHRGPLNLGTVKLTPEAATALLPYRGWFSMAGVKRLEPGVGDIIAKYESDVSLSLEEIDSVALARMLFRGPNSSGAVGSLRTLSPEIAREIVNAGRGVSLHRLETLSPEAARELARDDRGISILGPLKLTPETARALTDRKPRLVGAGVHLKGIKALDGPDAVAIAEALASTPGVVYLTYLERVSAKALAVLRTKPAIHLPPDDKLTIVAEGNE